MERILRVIDHIHAHLDEELAPKELAALACFSLHHFHRVFRGMTGESVMGFVRRLRLERAAQRLRFGPDSVTDVALSTGYASHEAFTRAFRARFGATPSVYRSETRVEIASTTAFDVRDEPERHCVSLRYTGSYEACENAWLQLQALGAALNYEVQMAGSVGLVYDDPEVTASEHLRYDACWVLPKEAFPEVLPEGCTHRVIPAGRYAVAHHRGPYEALYDTYVALLGRWLPFQDFELVDTPVVEIYLNNPGDTPPEALETEVCVQLK